MTLLAWPTLHNVRVLHMRPHTGPLSLKNFPRFLHPKPLIYSRRPPRIMAEASHSELDGQAQ